MIQILLIMILSIVIYFLGIKISKKIGLLDKPGEDQKIKRNPVPTIQGIFAYIGFWLILAIIFPEYYNNSIILGLLAGTLPIIIVEFLDEMNYIGKIKFKTPIYFRLGVHVLGAILALFIGGISVNERLIMGYTIQIPNILFYIFFILWTVICVNAINRFDYANGQASGVSSIGFLTIYLLIKFIVFKSYPDISEDNKTILIITQNISLIMFFISAIGAYVEYKPIGLLRDVGTMFFGFSLAYLSIVGGAKIGTLIVALSLVIFDAIWVTINRIFFTKKDPTQKDYSHIHHRLIGLGRTRSEVRIFVRSWSIIMMILMILQGSNRTAKVIIFFMMAIIFFGVNAYIFWIKKLPCGLKKN